MNKENILFGVIGLLLGFIVGFMFANHANQQDSRARTPAASTSNLPPDHPPLPSNAVADQSGASTGAGMPAVQAAIQKAKNEPDNFEAQKQAGEMYYQIQRFDEAVDFWLRANKLKPDDYETIVKLANTYYDLGKYELAEQWYTSALTKNPKDVNVRTDMASTFVERTPPDYDRAIKEYRRSLEIDPNHEQSLRNLTMALIRTGKAKEAQETLNKLTQVNPSNPDIPLLKSRLDTLSSQPVQSTPK